MNTFGLQRLVDSNQRVFNPGTPIYYVVENFIEANQPFTDLGLVFEAPVTGATVGGTSSTLIDPPPDVSELTASYIAAALQAGVALRSGAVKFTVSNTWVSAMADSLGFANPIELFENKQVVGIQFNGMLFTIVKAQNNDGTGGTLSWDVFCNTSDV